MNTRKLLKTLWEKGEIARNEQFLLFPQCFLLNQIIVSPFVHIFDIISIIAAEWKDPKICILGKGLKKKILRNSVSSFPLQYQYKYLSFQSRLTHSQTTNFRLFQTETVKRRQF